MLAGCEDLYILEKDLGGCYAIGLGTPTIITSTWLPVPKAGYPIMSFTRTPTALIPSGMAELSPAPASVDASFELRIGSLGDIGTITPRPMISWGSEKRPSGKFALGQFAMRSCCPVSRLPRESFSAATTIWTVFFGRWTEPIAHILYA